MNPDRSRAPRWLAAGFAVLAMLAGVTVAAWTIELPYFAWSPGPVFDTLGNVTVDESVEVYEPAGDLLMLTVSSQGLNAFEMVAGALDPTVDLVRREAVRREGETDEEYRERNLLLMDQSKENAIAAALDRVEGAPAIQSDGVEVVEVEPDAPASDFLEPGDAITAVDGAPVFVAQDIGEVIGDNEPGDTVAITVARDDESITAEVELIAAPDDPDRPLLGILARTLNPRYLIDINSANVGGPSAGLMYTLGIIELLTPGELTHGLVVAGTGTIAPDGTVGNIGGIRQKVVAAEAAGADVILVPEGNHAAALTAERSTIDIVPVESVDDALEYLAAAPAG